VDSGFALADDGLVVVAGDVVPLDAVVVEVVENPQALLAPSLAVVWLCLTIPGGHRETSYKFSLKCSLWLCESKEKPRATYPPV